MRVGTELALRARRAVLRRLQVTGDVVMLELRCQEENGEKRQRQVGELPVAP